MSISCSACGRPSVYKESESGSLYCPEHFTQYICGKVRGTLDRLPLRFERICVYFSAGKDSAVLVDVLRRHLNLSITALVADLGLEKYAEEVTAAGKKLCEPLGVPLHAVSLKNETGVSLEEIESRRPGFACHFCGELRNIVLDRASRRLNVDAVATGHNRDDVVRFLMNNFARNDIFRTAAFGAAMYPPPKLKAWYDLPFLLKPLINVTEKEIALYALLHGLPTVGENCSVGQGKGQAMQGWRRDLTRALHGLETSNPGFSARLINNFEKNWLPLLENMETKDLENRCCVFCKQPLGTESLEICLGRGKT